jgi:predicted DNA-binding transcriptional regulator YafY
MRALATLETVDADVLAKIASACRDNERLRFGYRSYDGSGKRRTVEPHRLVQLGRRWYLVAWDVDRSDWRSFRVDRITTALSVASRFPPRKSPPGGAAAFVARGASAVRNRWQAKVILHALGCRRRSERSRRSTRKGVCSTRRGLARRPRRLHRVNRGGLRGGRASRAPRPDPRPCRPLPARGG